MTDDFDPYYKWLGIRPKDQPPHHYRLLGIELFENDPDVIEQAADRQMAFLHTFKTGQHSALSQKLLNEVAAAKLCLLDAARRTDYDESLRARLAPANAAETAPSASAPARPPVQAPVRTTPTASPSIPIAAARPVVQAPVARQLPMGVAARVDERPRPNPKRLLMPSLAVVVAGLAAGGIVVLLAQMAADTAGTPQAEQFNQATVSPRDAVAPPAHREQKVPSTEPTDSSAEPHVPPFLPLPSTPPAPSPLNEAQDREQIAAAPPPPRRDLPPEPMPAQPAVVDIAAAVRKVRGRLTTENGVRGGVPIALFIDNDTATDSDLQFIQSLTTLRNLELRGRLIGDQTLGCLPPLALLTELTLDRAAITDAGLKNVATLHELTTLRLTNVPIGDAGLKHLRGLQHLKLLDLSRSQVAGPGLSQLRAPNLEELVLDGTKVSDRSMGFVGSLRGLRRISLEDTDIGDKGLLRLKTLKSLELVRTSGTRVTGGGILRFRQGKKVTVLEGRKNTVTPERQ